MLSLSFAKHTLGLRGEVDITLYGRVKGVSHAWFLKKRRLVQKAPLSVAQLCHLEKVVEDERRDIADRIAAGFFCFVAYSRARYSDALNVSSLKLDVVDESGKRYGFLEAQAARVKTSLTLEKKTMFLPMSVPVNSVSGLDWASAWMKLRTDESLQCGEGKPLLPAPGENRQWSSRFL